MTLANTPPGTRLSSLRETVPLLASLQQVGLPAVAASDAQLGHSVYTCQAGKVAIDMCGGANHVLWRVVGQRGRARGQTGNKTAAPQRAEVGFYPCCSTATHVAAPGSYSLGAIYPRKDVFRQLCQACGPRGLGVAPPFSTLRRMGISQKIGSGLHRPSMRISPLFLIGCRRRREAFVT